MMSRQEIFDKVSTHLLKQNAKAITTDEIGGNISCSYRTVDGLKCAVGCLVENYDPKIEGCLAFQIKNRIECGKIPNPNENIDWYSDADLLDELQCVHDQKSVDSWAFHLRLIAETHNLNISAALKHA